MRRYACVQHRTPLQPDTGVRPTLRRGEYGIQYIYNDPEKAVQLYVWDRKLSTAFFYDISILEVSLRNAIDHALCTQYGPNWYLGAVRFDERTSNLLSDAWSRLPAKYTQENRTGNRIRGRLITSCMFGTWAYMLDAGGNSGLRPPLDYVDHSQIWTRQLLISAFPGAKKAAGHEGKELDRSWVHEQIFVVHQIRNRIAHHESLIQGIPLPGRNHRLTTEEALAACRLLASMIDSELRTFLDQESDVTRLLAADPRKQW